MRAHSLENHLRKVARQAMIDTGKKRCDGKPIGVRIHLQFSSKNPIGLPPELLHQIAFNFVSALRGVVFNSAANINQLLVTKAWGDIDGIGITVWEIQ